MIRWLIAGLARQEGHRYLWSIRGRPLAEIWKVVKSGEYKWNHSVKDLEVFDVV